VLSAADFHRFLDMNPTAKEQIDRVMQERTLMNDRAAQESSAG
jgi:hypothetical protein